MRKKLLTLSSLFLAALLIYSFSLSQNMLEKLGKLQDFRSERISSYDRSGGNNDRLSIAPGETAVLADIKGPAAIHHIWVTIAAEAFYGRKLVLRMYWDGEKAPSVETPIGDFFSVGHGLNRNLSSIPINCSSEGRARNCYWYMPFRSSARITVTNEGSRRVGAFYYYIDYRKLASLPSRTPYFHAQYRQEMPCIQGKNYLILETKGEGHYVGCNLSILQRAMGWWGEGDDMIYVDGEKFPSLHGTGSEDYFSDAWGMREDENPFYGCPLQESDFQTGSKATVYRFHLPDPIPFKKSIRITIEHGHANNRSDFFSSVAYWYQIEPHKPFPPLPSIEKRLPFALESSRNFVLPEWEKQARKNVDSFRDRKSGMVFKSRKITHSLTSYYDQTGSRYPALMSEEADPGTTATLSFEVEISERYSIELYFLRGQEMGNLAVEEIRAGKRKPSFEPAIFEGYGKKREIDKIVLNNVLLGKGKNSILFRVEGKSEESAATEFAFVGFTLTPSSRRFVDEWNIIGPFDAPDMNYLQTVYPPEKEIDLNRNYLGKDGKEVSWQKIKSEESGAVWLHSLLAPRERTVAYGLSYVHSPRTMKTEMLVGSDDGVRVWLNDRLVHTNPAYRGAYPDQDKVMVKLQKGWNKVLIKVLQGGGGWGYYLRFVDPEEKLIWSAEPEK